MIGSQQVILIMTTNLEKRKKSIVFGSLRWQKSVVKCRFRHFYPLLEHKCAFVFFTQKVVLEGSKCRNEASPKAFLTRIAINLPLFFSWIIHG